MKGKGKSKSGTGKATGAAVGSGKQIDLDVLRQKIANYVGAKALLMVKTATEEAVKVSDLSAMKYLFELIGLHPAIVSAAEKNENGGGGNAIAAALLAELGISTNAEAEAVPDNEAAAAAESDSVE